MKAVILAGGRGKRLGVLSRYRPKPMLFIKGRPFLEYILARLKRYNFTDVIICTGYLSESIERYFGNGKNFGMRINYSAEKKPLGTAGALRKISSSIDGDFILLNGDSFINVDLSDMLEFHYRKRSRVTMAVTRLNNTGRYGRVEIDDDGYIARFSEKSGNGNFINAGLYICNRNLLKKLPPGYPSSLEREVFPHLQRGWILAYKTSSFFIDIGTVRDYCRLKAMSGKLPVLNSL